MSEAKAKGPACPKCEGRGHYVLFDKSEHCSECGGSGVAHGSDRKPSPAPVEDKDRAELVARLRARANDAETLEESYKGQRRAFLFGLLRIALRDSATTHERDGQTIADLTRERDELKQEVVLNQRELTILHTQDRALRSTVVAETTAGIVDALRPFASVVFNDNGDITYTFSNAEPKDYLRAHKIVRDFAHLQKEPTPNA